MFCVVVAAVILFIRNDERCQKVNGCKCLCEFPVAVESKKQKQEESEQLTYKITDNKIYGGHCKTTKELEQMG